MDEYDEWGNMYLRAICNERIVCPISLTYWIQSNELTKSSNAITLAKSKNDNANTKRELATIQVYARLVAQHWPWFIFISFIDNLVPMSTPHIKFQSKLFFVCQKKNRKNCTSRSSLRNKFPYSYSIIDFAHSMIACMFRSLFAYICVVARTFWCEF